MLAGTAGLELPTVRSRGQHTNHCAPTGFQLGGCLIGRTKRDGRGCTNTFNCNFLLSIYITYISSIPASFAWWSCGTCSTLSKLKCWFSNLLKILQVLRHCLIVYLFFFYFSGGPQIIPNLLDLHARCFGQS